MRRAILTIAATVGLSAGCMPLRSVTSFENEGNAVARPTMELEPDLDADWGIALGKRHEIPARVAPSAVSNIEARRDEVAADGKTKSSPGLRGK